MYLPKEHLTLTESFSDIMSASSEALTENSKNNYVLST